MRARSRSKSEYVDFLALALGAPCPTQVIPGVYEPSWHRVACAGAKRPGLGIEYFGEGSLCVRWLPDRLYTV